MLNKLKKIFSRKEETVLSEADRRWNLFLETVCMGKVENLSPVQRTAYLCFEYDGDVNNGGHGLYFDCHPDVDSQELAEAIRAVAHPAIADNFLKALYEGDRDDYAETDAAYFDFSPSLITCLQEYVERNRNEIFKTPE